MVSIEIQWYQVLEKDWQDCTRKGPWFYKDFNVTHCYSSNVTNSSDMIPNVVISVIKNKSHPTEWKDPVVSLMRKS